MALHDTKERALPAHPQQSTEDYLVYLKHVALYEFAKTFCIGKRVLDLGCGEGYGSATLSPSAHFVVAADMSVDAVVHAKDKYAQTNVAFVVCNAQHLPFANAAFDNVISFEVIEHLPNVRQYLEEIRRGVRAQGTAIISTPNRLLRLLPFQKPWNRFHLREYSAAGLRRAVAAVFVQVQVQGISAIPAILEIEKKRVRQNPLVAYPKMLAQMLLPDALFVRLRNARAHPQAKSLNAQPANFRERFSASDFLVSEQELNDCINLVAIAR